MYGSGSNEAELAVFGLTPEDVATEIVEVWPENWPAYLVFAAMSTQWRIGFSGPTGLDYSALPFVMRMKRIPRDDWDDLFNQIYIMESAALAEIRSNMKS